MPSDYSKFERYLAGSLYLECSSTQIYRFGKFVHHINRMFGASILLCLEYFHWWNRGFTSNFPNCVANGVMNISSKIILSFFMLSCLCVTKILQYKIMFSRTAEYSYLGGSISLFLTERQNTHFYARLLILLSVYHLPRLRFVLGVTFA